MDAMARATNENSVVDQDEIVPKSMDGFWCALVTQPLSPKDPRSRSPKAREAIETELAALRSKPVWDEENVMEKRRKKDIRMLISPLCSPT